MNQEKAAVYRFIVSFAEMNRIRLDEGYIVWVFQNDSVIQSNCDGVRVYLHPQDAVGCAERHNPKVRTFVTGPGASEYLEVVPQHGH